MVVRPPTLVAARPAGFLASARRTWVSHPRWSLAVKGALAATLAWFAGTVAPAPFSEYPYYAPLGAVLATTSTVVRSVRDSLQAVAAVLLGAVIARVVDLLPLPGALKIAAVVSVALVCVGWRILGDMGDWAVMSAIFVLILGEGDGVAYIGSYAGLIVVGAAIGIGVNLLLPPLPLTPSELALARLRDGLAEQVEALAGWLEDEGTLAPDEWEARRHRLFPTIEGARAAVTQTREASRANLRVRHNGNGYWVASQTRRAGALGTSAEVVDEIVRLLVEWERDGRDDVALGRHLRPTFAATLRAFASALRAAETREAAHADEAGAAAQDAADAVRRLDESLDDLRDQVRAARRPSDQDYFVAGALIVNLARGADALRSRAHRPTVGRRGDRDGVTLAEVEKRLPIRPAEVPQWTDAEEDDMATCDMCGNEYAHTITITKDDGAKGTFDSFECAVHAMAPRCAHCGCTVLGHGVEADDKTYCCSHCARVSTGARTTDSVGV